MVVARLLELIMMNKLKIKNKKILYKYNTTIYYTIYSSLSSYVLFCFNSFFGVCREIIVENGFASPRPPSLSSLRQRKVICAALKLSRGWKGAWENLLWMWRCRSPRAHIKYACFCSRTIYNYKKFLGRRTLRHHSARMLSPYWL